MRQIIFVAAVLLANAAIAAPVTWTLQDVVLNDGTLVNGYFVYDADAPIDMCTGQIVLETDPPCPVESTQSSTAYSDWNLNFFTSENSFRVYTDPVSYTDKSDQDNFSVSCYFDCGTGIYDIGFLTPDMGIYLMLDFASPLTNSGGVINLLTGWGTGLRFTSGVGGYEYSVVSGSVIANVVPIPAAVWLFGSALAALGWVRRKQAA